MPNKNKAKGNNVERQVAEILSEGTDTHFQRVPNSGAFLGGANMHRISKLTNAQTLLAAGDLIPGDGFEDCYIEVKSRKDFLFHHLFSENKEINSWIDQCMFDFDEVGAKCLLLIFKPNRKGFFVLTNIKHLKLPEENQ